MLSKIKFLSKHCDLIVHAFYIKVVFFEMCYEFRDCQG